ncbi:MAG: hypothetical protein HFJ22_07555 [Clostridia bacterium]|jgi:integrase|nr:hypothetical protein [Clostridia bacterium]
MMNNDYLEFQLGNMAKAVSDLDKLSADLKNSICVMLGYIQSDNNLDFYLQGGAPTQQTTEETQTAEVLEFTAQEISKMPKQFRTIFKTDGVRAHVRKRIRNNSISYEIRFRADGYNISASGLTVAEAKVRFIQKLHDAQNGIKPTAPDIPKTFDKFAMYYFENFRKRKVKSTTYEKDLVRLKKHILPVFGNMNIKDIMPQQCQKLIDDILISGKGKTAEDVFSLMNCTFKMAIKHNILQHNPLDIVIHEKHERKHGKALTIDEEKLLLQKAKEPYKTLFAIALYTGIRPNEYETVRITDTMIYANNSKRHNGKVETKRIPIIPILRPYINADTVMPNVSINSARKIIKKILGDERKLYDLRTTFYTRCQMYGVAPAARDEFVGHSSGKLTDTYTDLPDDYLIKEGLKLDY